MNLENTVIYLWQNPLTIQLGAKLNHLLTSNHFQIYYFVHITSYGPYQNVVITTSLPLNPQVVKPAREVMTSYDLRTPAWKDALKQNWFYFNSTGPLRPARYDAHKQIFIELCIFDDWNTDHRRWLEDVSSLEGTTFIKSL